MRKFFAVFRISVLLFLSGCSEKDKQNYVKNIMFSGENDNYKLTVEYYDFSGEEENYIKKEYTNADIYQLGAIAVKDGNYNFRLLENCFVSADVFRDNINKIIYIVNSLRIPVATDILCYTGRQLPDNFTGEKLTDTPLYNLSFTENKISGGFQITNPDGDNLGAVLVHNGKAVKVLDEKQWLVLNMLCNNTGEINYLFRNNEMLATLNNLNSYYSLEDETLKIDITTVLKEYKGIQNSFESKQLFSGFLKSDIENIIYQLYNDTAVDTVYNLHWYCNHKKKNCSDIEININII